MKRILADNADITYEEKDVVSLDLFCWIFDGWFLLGLGKATHTSSPFFIRTAFVDVTLVFWKF